MPRSPGIRSETPTSGAGGSGTGSSGSDSACPTSSGSGSPPSSSSERWSKPANVNELAAQANGVATAVLRGEIGLDDARVYSAIIRSLAQMKSAEVAHARFKRREPDLSL